MVRSVIWTQNPHVVPDPRCQPARDPCFFCRGSPALRLSIGSIASSLSIQFEGIRTIVHAWNTLKGFIICSIRMHEVSHNEATT